MKGYWKWLKIDKVQWHRSKNYMYIRWVEMVPMLLRRSCLQWNCIRRVPVCIKYGLQLGDDIQVISTEAHACCDIKIVPQKIAGSNVCPHITNSKLGMIDPWERWKFCSCCFSCGRIHGRPSFFPVRNLVVFNLHFSMAVVVGRWIA